MSIQKNLRTNLRDRLTAFTLITEGAEKDLSVFVERLTRLEPVLAVSGLAKLKGEGILNFVERQAEISRRWLGGK